MIAPAKMLKPRVPIEDIVEKVSKLALSAGNTESARIVQEASLLLLEAGLPNLTPLLPMLLNLKGEPYSLEDYFPFEPFFSSMMARKIILKCGRQVSKCVRLDDRPVIYMANGNPVGTSAVREGDMVLSVGPDMRRHVSRVEAVHDTGEKELLAVRTKKGSLIECTPEHKLLTPQGFTAAGDIKIGDPTASLRHGGVFGRGSIQAISPRFTIGDYAFNLDQDATAELLACWWARHGTIVFPDILFCYASDGDTAARLRSLLAKFFIGSSVGRCDITGRIVVSIDTLCDKHRFAYSIGRRIGSEARWPCAMGNDPCSFPSLDIFWDVVEDIQEIGKYPTVDFSIEDTRNYIYDGTCVHNSTSMAAQGIIISNCIPFFNTLYVTPLYEMIRRFSNNYVRSFIEQSPVRRLLVDTRTSSNVLQRSFSNDSNMFFSYAFRDADRTRGLAVDRLGVDEMQDMDGTFLPILRETMSGSKWGVEQYTGTPKTLENPIEGEWQRSSQAEWVIPCRNCRHENVPAMGYDLDDMIGPYRDDVSIESPGVICAKCRKVIHPRDGMWYHKYPERIADFSGYHVPQIILPMHYADRDKWGILTGKQQGAGNTPVNVFYNEVCGESYDTGAKLLTQTELEAAATLGPNTIEHAVSRLDKYSFIVMGVDWGGGGQKEVSFTTYAVVGMLPTGQLECIYGFRSLTPHDHIREAKIALDIASTLRCKLISHDFNGAGEFREKYMVDAGWPVSRLIPICYVRAASQRMFRFIPASEILPRNHYRLDKPRSLVMICHQIKLGGLRFFDYDHKGDDDRGLLHDFMALVEDKIDSRSGRDIYTIIRQQNMTDDFAHSINFACTTIWHTHQNWPNVAYADKFTVTEDMLNAMTATRANTDWSDF